MSLSANIFKPNLVETNATDLTFKKKKIQEAYQDMFQ